MEHTEAHSQANLAELRCCTQRLLESLKSAHQVVVLRHEQSTAGRGSGIVVGIHKDLDLFVLYFYFRSHC